MKVGICTLGCRTNIYESDCISSKLEEAGFEIVDFSSFADIYIVNTCSVTSEADKKSRQMIRRGKNINENAYVVCLGCYSQLRAQEAFDIGADYVCGNRNKYNCIEYIIAFSKGERKKKIDVLDLKDAEYEKENTNANISRDTVKAYVKIGDGCDNHCAYCIIREARGPVVSKPVDEIVKEAQALANNGYSEIILTGTEVASYGKDLDGVKLIDVLESLEKVEGIERIRLASIEPSILKEDFISRLAKLSKFMPSFHLSLQSGSDSVLASMKRKYNREMVKKSVSEIRKSIPNAEFSADIICGFPGETEKDFEDTLDLAGFIQLYHGHIFPYSDRNGTISSKMSGKIASDVKKERCEKLSELCKETERLTCSKYIDGKIPLKVLFEQRKGGYYHGHAENGLEVCYETDEDIKGKVVCKVPVKYNDGILYFESGIKEKR